MLQVTSILKSMWVSLSLSSKRPCRLSVIKEDPDFCQNCCDNNDSPWQHTVFKASVVHMLYLIWVESVLANKSAVWESLLPDIWGKCKAFFSSLDLHCRVQFWHERMLSFYPQLVRSAGWEKMMERNPPISINRSGISKNLPEMLLHSGTNTNINPKIITTSFRC